MEKSKLTKQMRWEIANRLAKERLNQVNMLCKKVEPRNSIYTRYVKRLLDIVISIIALFITLPINLLIGIGTYLDVGLPIFFRQERVGKNGRIFSIIKFRNMRDTVDERGELLPPMYRVTRFGHLIRKTSLDELLNFWNILKGDMSFIGPRPLVPEYTERYNVRHKQRLSVRPGLECPPRELTDHVWTWQEQFENDIWYVEHISFLTDCRQIIRLLQFAFNKKCADARASVSIRGTFMGYSMDGRAINMEDVPQEYADVYDNVNSKESLVYPDWCLDEENTELQRVII